MFRLSSLTFSLLSVFVLVGLCRSQGTSNPYLARMEHQTRQEDVCMLVQKDGHYHLERVITGHPQVFEGTLESSALTELQPLLTANQLVDLKQSQIEPTLVRDDIDQVMLTISRPNGWQTLTFQSGKSRKPYKSEIDPILKWLDRNKQQQNPIAGAATSRCIPPQTTQVAGGGAKSNPRNPYMMRILVDRYERAGSGATLSLDKGTAGESVGGVTNSQAMDLNAFKITRTCAIVYQSGQYRFERGVQDHGSLVRSEIYRDTLDKAQLDGLRQILDTPKLAALPDSPWPAAFAREGELVRMAVPRDKNVQTVSSASLPPRPASAALPDSTFAALSANIGLTNPIRKWVKQNIEDRKGEQAKDEPATACLPSAQPE